MTWLVDGFTLGSPEEPFVLESAESTSRNRVQEWLAKTVATLEHLGADAWIHRFVFRVSGSNPGRNERIKAIQPTIQAAPSATWTAPPAPNEYYFPNGTKIADLSLVSEELRFDDGLGETIWDLTLAEVDLD